MAGTDDEVVVRLKLKDLAAFVRDAKTGKSAVEGIEGAVKRADRAASRASSGGGGFSLMSKLLGSYAIARGVGALASGIGSIGTYAIKSAASMEQVQVSMETLLGSQSRATRMMADLQKFARTTPFEFSDVSVQAQHLLAFGFAARSVIPTLTAVGNAASGLSLGPEGMQRIITALGQIRAKGRLQGDEALQLMEAGVNVNTYLERAFHLTPKQLQKAQQAGKISAAAAIPVILKGMDDQFHGLMDKQSQTLGGIWSNFTDSFQQGLVTAVNPFLPTIKTWLQKAVDALPVVMRTVQTGISRAGEFLGQAMTRLDEIRNSQGFRDVIAMLQSGWDVVRDVVAPAVRDFAGGLAEIVASGIVAAAPTIKDFFDWIDQHPTLFKAVTVGALAFATAAWGLTAAISAATAASVAFDLVNPLVWIGAAVLALGAALYYAYTHSETFRRLVDTIWLLLKSQYQWISDNWSTIGPMLAAPFEAAAIVIKGIADAIAATWNQTVGSLGGPQIGGPDAAKSPAAGMSWLDRINILGSAVGGGGMAGVLSGIASGIANTRTGHADGGTITSGHTAWVGERGPELVRLPRGAQVIPLPRVGELAGPSRGPIHLSVELDGKVLATAVYDDMENRIARR